MYVKNGGDMMGKRKVNPRKEGKNKHGGNVSPLGNSPEYTQYANESSKRAKSTETN